MLYMYVSSHSHLGVGFFLPNGFALAGITGGRPWAGHRLATVAYRWCLQSVAMCDVPQGEVHGAGGLAVESWKPGGLA